MLIYKLDITHFCFSFIFVALLYFKMNKCVFTCACVSDFSSQIICFIIYSF